MAPQKPRTEQVAPTTPGFSMKVSDYAVGSVRVASRVPDEVADLLEDLREAHGREITVKSGQVVPAGQAKYRVVEFDTEELAAAFKKHALSYSKAVMTGDGYSVRLSHISPTSIRVGVGTVVPKPRKPKNVPENTETTEA